MLGGWRELHFVCMDWRHVGDLIEIGPSAYGEMLNIVVWNKSNAGQGSFYRSKHELICVFLWDRAGTEIILNWDATAAIDRTSGATQA